MASFIGIDLGTTYSVISYIDDTGRPKVIHNSDGENITASWRLGEDSWLRKNVSWNVGALAGGRRNGSLLRGRVVIFISTGFYYR